MAISSAGRFGAPGMGTDAIRVLSRALELVSSNAVGSDNELLEMVKRAKKDMDKEPFHPPKKSRSVRHSSEASEMPSSGHRASSASAMAPPPDRSGSPLAAPWTESGGGGGGAGSGAAAASGGVSSLNAGPGVGNTSMTHTQARLLNVMRGNPSRGRIEKPKRKATR